MVNAYSRYRIEFASGVWRDVGVLPRHLYDHVSDALEDVAQNASGRTDDAPSHGRIDTEEFTVRYEIDHSTRTVLVLDLLRRAASAS